jgi:hypothetical protein
LRTSTKCEKLRRILKTKRNKILGEWRAKLKEEKEVRKLSIILKTKSGGACRPRTCYNSFQSIRNPKFSLASDERNPLSNPEVSVEYFRRGMKASEKGCRPIGLNPGRKAEISGGDSA